MANTLTTLDLYTQDKTVPHEPVFGLGGPGAPAQADAPAQRPRQLQTKPVELMMDRRAIRDTARHFPDSLLDTREAKLWVFEVVNNLNQAITIDLIGSLIDQPASAGDVGVTATIPAGTTEPVITSTWSPFLGLTVTAAVAPTTGDVSIRGTVQIEE